MPPPELARDVPVGRILERVDRVPVLRLGVVADPSRPECLERRLLELLHRAPPLQRDQRLDSALAALAERDGVPVRLAPLEQAVLPDPVEDPRLGLLLRQAGELTGLVVHATVGADHGQLRKAVVTSDLEVEGVVSGRHLQRAGAELRIDALVADHGHGSLDERHDHLTPDRRPPALVFQDSPPPPRRRGSSRGRAVAIVTPLSESSANG